MPLLTDNHLEESTKNILIEQFQNHSNELAAIFFMAMVAFFALFTQTLSKLAKRICNIQHRSLSNSTQGKAH